MRINIKTSPNNSLVPFNYQNYLTGAVHKWLGNNNLFHDKLSLYSFSWLSGAKPNKAGLNFPKGATFFISAYNEEFIRQITKRLMSSPEIGFGMKVIEVTLQDTPQFTDEHIFYVASPVLVKRNNAEGKQVHFTFSQKIADEYITQTLRQKLREVNLSDSEVFVEFNREYLNPITKIISYGEIKNRVNICPIIVKGTPEQIAFAWNVGIGNSTGIGFGALK